MLSPLIVLAVKILEQYRNQCSCAEKCLEKQLDNRIAQPWEEVERVGHLSLTCRSLDGNRVCRRVCSISPSTVGCSQRIECNWRAKNGWALRRSIGLESVRSKRRKQKTSSRKVENDQWRKINWHSVRLRLLLLRTDENEREREKWEDEDDVA